MADWTKFNPFVEALAEKVHDLGGDTLMIALTDTPPAAANAMLTDIAEITAAGGYAPANVTITNSSQTGGTYSLMHDAVTFTAAGADFDPFRFAVLYNDSAPNKELVAWFDYGVSYTLPNGQSFVINSGTILSLA